MQIKNFRLAKNKKYRNNKKMFFTVSDHYSAFIY